MSVTFFGPCYYWVIDFHSAHSSLRSLDDTVMASLRACVSLAVESLALRCASSGVAAAFGYIHESGLVGVGPAWLGTSISRSQGWR